MDLCKAGRAIAARRREMGLTQRELAERVHVTHQAVSKWEKGAALPDTATLYELSRLFHTTVDALLSGETPRAIDGPMSDWQAMAALGPYLSPGTRDVLFDHALKGPPPAWDLVCEICAPKCLSDRQTHALVALALRGELPELEDVRALARCLPKDAIDLIVEKMLAP